VIGRFGELGIADDDPVADRTAAFEEPTRLSLGEKLIPFVS
jgi:hypothetical protein